MKSELPRRYLRVNFRIIITLLAIIIFFVVIGGCGGVGKIELKPEEVIKETTITSFNIKYSSLPPGEYRVDVKITDMNDGSIVANGSTNLGDGNEATLEIVNIQYGTYNVNASLFSITLNWVVASNNQEGVVFDEPLEAIIINFNWNAANQRIDATMEFPTSIGQFDIGVNFAPEITNLSASSELTETGGVSLTTQYCISDEELVSGEGGGSPVNFSSFCSNEAENLIKNIKCFFGYTSYIVIPVDSYSTDFQESNDMGCGAESFGCSLSAEVPSSVLLDTIPTQTSTFSSCTLSVDISDSEGAEAPIDIDFLTRKELRLDTSGYASGIAISGSYAYVADEVNGFLKVDINTMTEVSHLDTANASGVAISDSYAYVADGLNGLLKVDINTMSEAGHFGTSGFARDVAITRSYVYAADESNGLLKVNKNTMSEAGHFDTVGNASSLDISGNYAYVAYGIDGLVKADISTMTETGRLDTAGTAFGLAISGSYAYVADGVNGLLKVDISTMTETSRLDTAGAARDIAISGSYVYVADGSNGLVKVDINAMSEAGHFDTGGYASDVVISGSYAYVADGYNGLLKIDITNNNVE